MTLDENVTPSIVVTTEPDARLSKLMVAAAVTEDAATNQVYNVAYGERTNLKELFQMILQQVVKRVPGAESAEVIYRDFRAGDVLHSLADISKAKRLLGYRPGYSIGTGITEAAHWYIYNPE